MRIPLSLRHAAAPLLALCGLLALALGGCASQPPAYSGFITATEFTPGLNRFPFVLADMNGALLEDARITVRFVRLLPDGGEAQVAQATAAWLEATGSTPHPHPDGPVHLHQDIRGYYTVAAVDLPVDGIYQALMEGKNAQGRTLRVEGPAFRVATATRALPVGAPAPPTRNPTLREVPFAELSSRAVPTDALHAYSVAEALAREEPFVVGFASPAFCVSALCGPVVDEMDAAHAALSGRTPFIHIEPWMLTVAREEGRLVQSPESAEWGLPSEPWVFVVGADGRIAARFEGLVNHEELLAALAALGTR